MLESKFIEELKIRGFKVDCFNGEDLVVLKEEEIVARVSAFEPLRMNTLETPEDILPIIVKFSSTPHEERF
jgi:hypothetical protein